MKQRLFNKVLGTMKYLQVLLCCLLIILSGCSQKSNDHVSKNSISVGIPRESGSMDPAGAIANTYLTTSLATTDELITFDDQDRIEYRGAVAYEQNEEATQWTLHLRKEARWSTGEPITAQDYVRTIQRALNPQNGSGYADYLFFIENAEEIYHGQKEMDALGILVPDDYTLIFQLKEPCVYFLKLLRLPVYHPTNIRIEQEGSQSEGVKQEDAWMIGSGPFYIQEYYPNDLIVLAKNEYYWDQQRIALDEIRYQVINNEQILTYAYETGEIDVAPNIDAAAMQTYQGNDAQHVSTMTATRYIYPNLSEPVLQERAVRQALALAIDREQLCQIVGNETIPTTHFVATGIKEPGSDEDFIGVTGSLFQEDVALARELLKEAGYPNGRGFPEISYSYPALELDSDVAQVLQAQWKQNLGITVRLVPQELQTHYAQRRAGNFDLSRMHWTADFSDPYTYLSMLQTQSTYNCSGVRDQAYDDLLQESKGEKDLAKRSQLLHRAEARAVGEEFYVIPLFSINTGNLIRPNITGVRRVPASGALDYRYAKRHD